MIMNSAAGGPILDIYETRWIIFTSVFIAIVFALIYVKFMDLCAFQCAWASVILVGFGLVGTGSLCWMEYNERMVADADEETNSVSNAFWWGAIVAWTLSVLYVMCLICYQSSLRTSIRIIETAGDFLADTKRVLAVPLLFFAISIVWFFTWLYGYMCIKSIGTITNVSYQTQLRDIEYGPTVNNMLWIMIFGLFWTMAFLMSCNEFVVVVSAASWYFSDKTVEDDDGIPGDAKVWEGFAWIFRYHFGSLAMGSLLISIVWMIRFVFEYVANKMEKSGAGENGFTKALIGCTRCCLGCFDRMLRYLTRNAYIYMAISSESFCNSALNAFILMLKNAAKFAFVQTFSEVFMFIAKIAISVATTATGILWIVSASSSDVTSPVMPGLLILLIAYIVSGIFVSIFDAGSNTILQCYLIDKDIAKQGGEHLEPTHIPETLKKFLVEKEEEKDELHSNLIN